METKDKYKEFKNYNKILKLEIEARELTRQLINKDNKKSQVSS